MSCAIAGTPARRWSRLLVAAVTTLAVPIAVRRMIDFGFSRDSATLIDSYFTVMIGLVGVLALASAARFYLVTTLGERIVADLREAVFGHIVLLSPAYFDQAKSGELISRLTADTTQIKAAVGASVSIALRNLVLFIGATTMMVVTSPRLSAFVLGAIPVIVLPLYGFGRAVRRRSRAAQDTLADATAYASELIGAVRVLQAFTNEALATGRFGAAVERAFAAARDSIKARAVLTGIAIFLVFASVVVVLWVGAQDVLDGRISAGRLSQFVLYAVFAAAGLGQLSEVWGEVSQAAGAAERLFEILNVRPRDRQPGASGPRCRSRRAARSPSRMCASPIRRGPTVPVLDGVSFAVRRGEKVAIVGPSGAGKSTIFHLILRFYDPVSGAVRFDGVPLPDVDPLALRRRIALVPQDTVVFAAIDPREHPLRPAGGERRARSSARPSSRTRVGIHRPAAAEARHAGRRARGHAVGRPAPAHRHRPRHPARRAAAAARRGDLLARRRERDAGAGRARAADGGAHHARDRAPARDRAVLRPHSGDGGGPHRRGRHAREARRRRRPLRAPRPAAIPERIKPSFRHCPRLIPSPHLHVERR